MNDPNPFRKTIAALLIGGVALRIFCFAAFSSLNGDSAVAALMAKHISEGREFPIYFWLGHYGGALSSYLAAGLFRLMGVSTPVFNLTGLLYSCLWLLLVYLCARKMQSAAGVAAALLVTAFPPYNIMMSSQFAGGIQAETLIFGSWTLLVFVRWRETWISYGLLGFVLGFGFWVTPSMAPWFIVASVVFWLRRRIACRAKDVVIFIVFLLIGFAPGILYEIQHPLAQLLRFSGRIAQLDRSALGAGSWAGLVLSGVVRRFSLVVPSLLRVPSLFVRLAGPLSLVLVSVAFIRILRERPWRKAPEAGLDPWLVLVLFAGAFTVFYSFLVGDPVPRYMLSYYVVAPFLVGRLFSEYRRGSVRVWRFLFIVTIAANLSTYVAAFPRRETDRYADLVRFLRDRQVRYAYSDYWTAYPAVFESGEQIIVSPTLLHPNFSERRPAYTASARAAAGTSFIVDDRLYPFLSSRLDEDLRDLGVTYRKGVVRDFSVYFDLGRKVFPEELKL